MTSPKKESRFRSRAIITFWSKIIKMYFFGTTCTDKLRNILKSDLTLTLPYLYFTCICPWKISLKKNSNEYMNTNLIIQAQWQIPFCTRMEGCITGTESKTWTHTHTWRALQDKTGARADLVRLNRQASAGGWQRPPRSTTVRAALQDTALWNRKRTAVIQQGSKVSASHKRCQTATHSVSAVGVGFTNRRHTDSRVELIWREQDPTLLQAAEG